MMNCGRCPLAQLGQVKLIFCLASPSQILNAKCGKSFLFFIFPSIKKVNAGKLETVYKVWNRVIAKILASNELKRVQPALTIDSLNNRKDERDVLYYHKVTCEQAHL